MNSKEALIILFASYNYNGNYQEVIEAREKIEKDLEVLDILKLNVVSLNMITIFKTCEGYNDWAREYHRYGYLLTKEQFNKVKEFLKNE